ncbi:hypothetical protein [Lacihabitans lacunae]|uniref:Uncharacterized protein n=1 Tax=Lacihabitans lacunae TaxID=1028214 RepID=A0ABV7Z4M6_9BACT
MDRLQSNKMFADISKIIHSFNESLAAHIPKIDAEITQMIDNKNKDTQVIERYLDTLLSLTMYGIGDELFIKLLEYYKTVDAEGAEFYWNEYDKDEE